MHSFQFFNLEEETMAMMNVWIVHRPPLPFLLTFSDSLDIAYLVIFSTIIVTVSPLPPPGFNKDS